MGLKNIYSAAKSGYKLGRKIGGRKALSTIKTVNKVVSNPHVKTAKTGAILGATVRKTKPIADKILGKSTAVKIGTTAVVGSGILLSKRKKNNSNY
ncbi:MAG: hypothetical protein AABY07_10865 [Nanoarchaeota archaeon]